MAERRILVSSDALTYLVISEPPFYRQDGLRFLVGEEAVFLPRILPGRGIVLLSQPNWPLQVGCREVLCCQHLARTGASPQQGHPL